MDKTQLVHVRLPVGIAEFLRAEAFRLRVSQAELIRRALVDMHIASFPHPDV